MEKCRITDGSLIGELVVHQLMGNKPANEDTGEEAHSRQEQLTRDKVKHIEDGHAKKRQFLANT